MGFSVFCGPSLLPIPVVVMVPELLLDTVESKLPVVVVDPEMSVRVTSFECSVEVAADDNWVDIVLPVPELSLVLVVSE